MFSRSGVPVPSNSRAPVSQSRPCAGAGAAISAGNLCVTSIPPLLAATQPTIRSGWTSMPLSGRAGENTQSTRAWPAARGTPKVCWMLAGKV